MTKKIGILTSGGDCSGLNAVIRAATFAAHEKGWEIYGILESTEGLLKRPVAAKKLDVKMFDGAILRTGGTMLGTTNKGTHSPFSYPMPDGTKKDRTQDIIAGYNELGLDAVICIGGDGSQALLKRIADQGNMNVVAVPKTIDNDIGSTEMAVGFDTAVMVATEALDRLQPTAASHERVMILEVMGRDAGHIAMRAGIAGGANIILIPEIDYKLEHITRKIKTMRDEGRMHALVVVSEAVKGVDGESLRLQFSDGQTRHGGIGHHLGAKIAEATGADTRVTVLGHIQRGGTPTANDRLIATAFGVHAVELIDQGKFDHMVAWKNRKVVAVPISEVVKENQQVNTTGTLVSTARAMGICLGDR